MRTCNGYEQRDLSETHQSSSIVLVLAKALLLPAFAVFCYAVYAGDGVLGVYSFVALMGLVIVVVLLNPQVVFRCSHCGQKMKQVLTDVRREELSVLGVWSIDSRFKDSDAVIVCGSSEMLSSLNRVMKHLVVCDGCRAYSVVDPQMLVTAGEDGRPNRIGVFFPCEFRDLKEVRRQIQE
jgi:hypothetical protein